MVTGALVCLAACQALPPLPPALSSTPAITAPLPEPSNAPATALPASAPAPSDSGWRALAPGFERRALVVPFLDLGLAEHVVLFRVDPARHRFRVLYAPGFPGAVAAFDGHARLVFNAGFFDENNVALGLLVSDGQAFGQSFVGFGGMLAVDTFGQLRLQSLRAEPYAPAEALAQAVQGFPMLIQADGTLYTSDDEARARRTALGLDDAGRLVVVIAPDGAFTLAGLARWLYDQDLGLTRALNLDGGGSTGYYAGPEDRLDSFTPVPAVIAVYAAGQ